MIKNVIFDLGGVVVNWNPQHIMETFTEAPGLIERIGQSSFFLSIWSQFDRGELSRKELVKKAAEVSGFSEEICDAFVEHIKTSLKDIPETHQLIRELSTEGYRLFCLSNLSEDFYEYLKRRDVFRYFEGKVISAREHLIKPEPAIYRLILERYQLQPEETLFIDDLEANVRAAEALGIRTVHFTDKEKGYAAIRALLC